MADTTCLAENTRDDYTDFIFQPGADFPDTYQSG
jgi:hypothetical protein